MMAMTRVARSRTRKSRYQEVGRKEKVKKAKDAEPEEEVELFDAYDEEVISVDFYRHGRYGSTRDHSQQDRLSHCGLSCLETFAAIPVVAHMHGYGHGRPRHGRYGWHGGMGGGGMGGYGWRRHGWRRPRAWAAEWVAVVRGGGGNDGWRWHVRLEAWAAWVVVEWVWVAWAAVCFRVAGNKEGKIQVATVCLDMERTIFASRQLQDDPTRAFNGDPKVAEVCKALGYGPFGAKNTAQAAAWQLC